MENEIIDETVLPVAPEAEDTPENELALVQRTLATIREDQAHFKPSFDRMREDMQLATFGYNKNWPKGHYSANIVGRHVKQKTAALYAKNPKIVARRKETLDFQVWDENPDTLMMAFQQVQIAQQAMASGVSIDPMTGQPVAAQMPPGMEQAMAIMQDFQAGIARRQEITKIGKTLEVLFHHAMRAQQPLDFKMGMKKLVRRVCTTGVGYVKLAFAREMGPAPVVTEQMNDVRQRLAHLDVLAQDAAEGEIESISAEMRELELSMQALQQEEMVVVQEGLIFDYPQSTRVIPDKNTMSLVGFVGARHLTLDYLFTESEVREQFPDADLERGFTPYRPDWTEVSDSSHDAGSEPVTDSNGKDRTAGRGGMVRVFEHYDKPSGLVYYLADGYPGFLRAPAPPDVFVDTFWPVYALTFNEVENERELFPPSDAWLMQHQQFELNRARQGQREHREAARPRFVSRRGSLEDEDKIKLASAQPFDVIDINLTPEQDIKAALEAISIPGVDPNLYETSPFFQDMQLVVGSQQATLGGIAKATATESAIAANSMAASDGSSVDDLDNFLTVIARAGGQVLLREMSPDRVVEVVGPGAVWPEMTLDQIADELFLEIEAGSTGKPNQAVEIDNWKQMLPMMINLPGIQPLWLARETVRRLDDKVDLTEAVAAGIPSIAVQNQMTGAPTNVSPDDPNANPQAQGAEGGANAPAGPSMVGPGTDAAFGSNQV